jgi:DNA mismatch repair protein MutS2
MKEEQIRLEKKQLDARRIEARKFAKMLEEKEQILKDILEKLKSDPSRKIVAKSWDDIKFVKRDALNEAENVPSVVARKKKAAAALEETSAELVPIAELRDKPQLKEGDSVVVVKKGALFGREASVIKALSGRVEVRVNNMNLTLKLSQVALPNSKVSIGKSSPPGPKKGDSISKAAEKAIAAERGTREESDSDWLSARPDSATNKAGRGSGGGVTMRTQSNTVDVRGCNLSEAQEKVKQKISSSLMSNNSVVYILHGHGTGGVLKSKIRNWLKSERQLVKKFEPADVSDGGDALTRVDLR